MRAHTCEREGEREREKGKRREGQTEFSLRPRYAFLLHNETQSVFG